MNNTLVEADGLVKRFKYRKRGTIDAVNGVSFDAYQGEIFGLLGPNAAGKTTTLRMLATILSPTVGAAFISGFDVRTDADNARRSLGFLSGDTGLYGRLTAREMMVYFGELYGLSGSSLQTRVDDLGARLGMTEFFDRRCDKLSTGQKQKVSIARTVVHNPPVLILDEPTAGLDVLAARNIVQFIRSAREDGKCVILSTHDLGEAERLCDRVAIIHSGKIAAMGTKDELLVQFKVDNLETVFLKAVGVKA